MSKEELQNELNLAKQRVAEIEERIYAFDTAPENNVFASLEEASSVLEDRLTNQAFKDCEGAHNCGAEEYSQEFIVDGIHYIGTLKLEYNRHDKTYYYIDGSRWSVEKKE